MQVKFCPTTRTTEVRYTTTEVGKILTGLALLAHIEDEDVRAAIVVIKHKVPLVGEKEK